MAEQTLDQFAAWCEKKAALLKRFDHKAALQEILADLLAGVAACFDESHDPDGRPWKELDIPFRRPLWGKSRKMITRVLSAHRRAKAESSRFVVTIDAEIAGKHNLGRGRPKREFLGLSNAQLDRAEALIADRVMKELLKD